MSSLTDYKRLSVLTPDPIGLGGLAINRDFKMLADRFAFLATTDPSSSDDSSEGFAVGSRWFNTATSTEWICINDTMGAAVWSKSQAVATLEQVTTAGPTTDRAITMSNGLSLSGSSLKLNNGSGSGGGSLLMDGGNVSNAALVSATTLDVKVAANHHVSTLGYNPTTNDYYLSLGWIGTDAYIIAIQQGVGSAPIHLDLGSGSLDNAGEVTATTFFGGTVSFAGGGGAATITSDGDGGLTFTDRNGFTFSYNGWDNNGFSITPSVSGDSLNLNGGNLRNFVVDPASTAPGSPSPGQLYYDTGANALYVWDGSQWRQLQMV